MPQAQAELDPSKFGGWTDRPPMPVRSQGHLHRDPGATSASPGSAVYCCAANLAAEINLSVLSQFPWVRRVWAQLRWASQGCRRGVSTAHFLDLRPSSDSGGRWQCSLPAGIGLRPCFPAGCRWGLLSGACRPHVAPAHTPSHMAACPLEASRTVSLTSSLFFKGLA